MFKKFEKEWGIKVYWTTVVLWIFFSGIFFLGFYPIVFLWLRVLVAIYLSTWMVFITSAKARKKLCTKPVLTVLAILSGILVIIAIRYPETPHWDVLIGLAMIHCTAGMVLLFDKVPAWFN